MSPARTVHVTRLASHRGSGRRDEPQPDRVVDQTEQHPRCEADKRGNKRVIRGEKTWSPLKVKLPKFNAHTLSKKKATREDNTPSWWTLKPAENRTMTVGRRGGSRAADADSFGADVFFFSQRPSSKATDEKQQAKVSVLRTISRMLEENQRIRQRLLALTQAH